MSKTLFFFVEGHDDRRFVDSIIRPRLKSTVYANLIPVEYAREQPDKINSIITCCNMSPNFFDYRLLVDRDDQPEIGACRKIIQRRFPPIDIAKVYMVRTEIESWYLAGLNTKALLALGVRFNERVTDDIAKEQFDLLKPSRFKERRLFLIEILAKYNVMEAKRRNSSFKTFCDNNQSIVAAR